MASTDQLAWAAGLFEGEGSISLTPIKRRPNSIKVSVSICMTDEDVVRRFCQIMEIGVVKGPYKSSYPSGKVRYVWEIQNQQGCVEALRKLLPWFGERRALKAALFINTIERRRNNG